MEQQNFVAAEDIIDCIDDNLLEWSDICVYINNHFPNGIIPDVLQDRLNELVSDQEVNISFNPEQGWIYQDLS